MRRSPPVFWSVIDGVATTKYQRKRNTHKDPTNRLLAIYLKYKGLTAKACDALHSLGLTMSSKWVTDAIDQLSDAAMKEVREMIQNELGCATAAIVHVKKDAPKLPPSVTVKLLDMRAAGMHSPLTVLEIFDLDEKASAAILPHMVYYVLRTLLESDEFNVARNPYTHRKSVELKRPDPIEEVPCGPEHISEEYMLGTMHILESSYEGNKDVLDALLDQLGFKGVEERRKLVQLILFLQGDQLTVDRLRNLQKLCCQDYNAVERMDNVLAVWGWLHALMAYAKSLHKQYLGTETGHGFAHAFGLLNRYDLLKTSTQGAFHEKFERFMEQVLEAHLRALWCTVAGVDKLEELLSKTPEELVSYAETIVRNHACSRYTTMLVRDLLRYFVLRDGLRRGDVGIMEASLPYMLLRFVGGKNSHYSIEMLETLQGLHHEWPTEVW
ncbi:hypothetical protein K474DRAFT_1687450 [Panus rudis PR-1116 ss-1]|nr:hypothetical protein K474DRAFT_1687450 [Panus rudis PR-1116 ss-1]